MAGAAPVRTRRSLRSYVPKKAPLLEGEKDFEKQAFLVLAALWAVQLFIYIDAANGSDLPLGAFSGDLNYFNFYFIGEILGFGALIAFRSRPASDPFGGWARLTRNLSLARFVLWGGITAIVSWGLFSIGYYTGILNIFGPFQSYTSTLIVQNLIFYFVWVAVAEEFIFRAALPMFLGKWRMIWSSVVFALFHLSAYWSQIVVSAAALEITVIELFFIGIVLYLVYQRWGYGPAVFLHGTYDCVVAGVLAPILGVL